MTRTLEIGYIESFRRKKRIVRKIKVVSFSTVLPRPFFASAAFCYDGLPSSRNTFFKTSMERQGERVYRRHRDLVPRAPHEPPQLLHVVRPEEVDLLADDSPHVLYGAQVGAPRRPPTQRLDPLGSKVAKHLLGTVGSVSIMLHDHILPARTLREMLNERN